MNLETFRSEIRSFVEDNGGVDACCEKYNNLEGIINAYFKSNLLKASEEAYKKCPSMEENQYKRFRQALECSEVKLH